MKTVQISALCLITVSLSIFSCKKEKSPTENPAATSELVGKDWRMIGATYTSPNGNGNLFLTKDSCSMDDLMEFKSNGKLAVKQGWYKCEPLDPDVQEDGTWQLLNNNTMVRIIDGKTTDYEIIELNCNILQWKMVQEDNGVKYTYYFSYKKN